MGYDKIPAELRQRIQWVCHRYPNKMPLCPIPGENGSLFPASCKARETWGTFSSAVDAVRNYGAKGIGIELADGICGIDIDHCVDDGEPSAMAKDIIATLCSYTEFSPSGTGIHIICKGALPAREGNRDSLLGLEMYDRGRYFTVTGNVYCDEDGYVYPLRECTAQINAVHLKYFTKPVQEQLSISGKEIVRDIARNAPQPLPGPSVGNSNTVRDLTDEQIIEIAYMSKTGENLRRLYEGQWSTSDYPSQSEADYALVRRLAFWFNKDAARMDRVFRASALMRPKWERSVGHGKTYGQRSIERAIEATKDTFIPFDRSPGVSRSAAPLPEPPPLLERVGASRQRDPWPDEDAPPPQPQPLQPQPPPLLERVGDSRQRDPWPDEGAPLPQPPPPPPGKHGIGPPPSSPPLEAAVIQPDRTEYTFDDTGNAYRFRDAFYSEIKYDHINSVWLYWTGRQWAEDKYGFVKLRADRLLRDMRKEAEDKPNGEGDALFKHFRRSRSSKSKKAMMEETQHMKGITIKLEQLDCHKNLLNVENGIVDLRSGELRPHDRNMYMTMIANVSSVRGATCPRWLRFLDDITEGDTELQRYLQCMAGYCATGSTAEQCLFFLYGTGSNGKTTFVNVLNDLLGDYTKNVQAETIMLKDRGNASAARSDVARLKGARLVTTSEPSGGCQLDEGMVKQMTGDDIITTRRLYKDTFEFRPEFKIIMGTNIRPGIPYSDYGIWRRIRIVPLTALISEDRKDLRLLEKLRAERIGIFQWVLEGAVAWYRDGMPRCARVTGAIEDYRKEVDKIRQFEDDCIVKVNGQTLTALLIYTVYRNWCAENGERYPMTNNRFSQELQNNCGLLKRKTKKHNEYLDVTLTEIGERLAAQSENGGIR